MSLTVTQTQILSSHLAALRHASSKIDANGNAPNFTPQEVLSSLIYELGPFVAPMIADAIIDNPLAPTLLTADQLELGLDTIDKLEDELNDCIAQTIPPGNTFRELLAKLLEQLSPILINILIGFLLEPTLKKNHRFSRQGL